MTGNRDTFAALRDEFSGTEEYFLELRKTYQKNTNSAELKNYTKSFTGKYNSDFKRAERAYNAIADKISDLDPDKVSKSELAVIEKMWDKLEVALDVLEAHNRMFSAYIEEKVISKMLGAVTAINLVVRAAKIDEANKQVEEILKLLKKAKREVTEAKAQMAINLTLTAFSTVVAPQFVALQGARVAVMIAAAGLTTDALLGPKGPDAAGTAKGAATTYAGIAKKFPRHIKKAAGPIGGLMTLDADAQEIGAAKKSVKKIQAKLKPVKARLEALAKGAADGPRLLALMISLEKGVLNAQAASTRFKTHQKARKRALREFETID